MTMPFRPMRQRTTAFTLWLPFSYVYVDNSYSHSIMDNFSWAERSDSWTLDIEFSDMEPPL